jgi:homoserine acetyltransferase
MQKLLINTETYNGVPLNEYYLQDSEYKGLVFIQHGYQSNKNYGADYLALTIARLGFFVVSIDAYMHGERIEGSYLLKDAKGMLVDAPAVIRHTAIDYIKLHKKRYIDRFPVYDFIGISMGAMIAFYLATKTDKVNKLIPVIGTPDFIHQAKYNLTTGGFKLEDFLNDYTIKYLNRMSPVNNVRKINFKKMLIMNCRNDKIVPMDKAVEFYNVYKSDDMTLKIYEDGHDINRTMQQDIFNFISN